MRKSKFSESQIVSFLKEAEAGRKVSEICREHGVSTATFYQWRSKYGGMEASDMKRLKELQSENEKLKMRKWPSRTGPSRSFWESSKAVPETLGGPLSD